MKVIFTPPTMSPIGNGDVQIRLVLADDHENHDVREASISITVSEKLSHNFRAGLRENVMFEVGGTGPKV